MKKLYSVFADDLEHCYITKSPYVALHHIFGGANRKRSEKYGFILPLRPDWHNMSNYSVHSDRDLDLKYKCMAQDYYLEHYGSQDDFRREFGKWW